jgi:hypothetical protein
MFSYIQRLFVRSFLTRQAADIQWALESLDLVFKKVVYNVLSNFKNLRLHKLKASGFKAVVTFMAACCKTKLPHKYLGQLLF